MPDPIALLRLPDPEFAPAYRESLELRSHFAVNDFGDDIVSVAPAEGPGTVAAHFSLTKLCDAKSDLKDPALWSPLERHPPRRRGDVDADEYREEMLRRGREITSRNESAEAQMVAFALAAFAAAQDGGFPELLTQNLPPLFEQFPSGSLWLVAVDDVLLARLAFGRAQLAFQLTPDMPLGPETDALRAFSELTLTRGIDFAAIMNPPLLALSPSVLGFLVPAMPHVLVFCFGGGVDLRRPYPISLSSLYRPGVLNDSEGLDRSALLANSEPDDGPRLLAWWVDRLNELYSHATDPTRFTGEDGYHDAAAQTAWMVTLERLIGDAVSLLSEPQATDLDRVQMTFDLLDKAESLLGYGRKRSGKGFAALLRRSESVPRIREALRSLPEDLASRIGDEVQRLFDELYAQVRVNTLTHRLTGAGAMIATTSPDEFEFFPDDRLVASLCRAVRNSSHGLLDTLDSHQDRFLLASNTDGIPAELPALAPLIAMGILADTPSLVDGSWRTKLVTPLRADGA